MIRGRTLLVAGMLAGLALAGCDGSTQDRAVAERPLVPVSESLPPASVAASPGRLVLAPEDPVRTVLPGDEMPADEPTPTATPAQTPRARAATDATPTPARTWRPRETPVEGQRRTAKKSGNLKRRTPPEPPVILAPAQPPAKPKKAKKPKDTQVPEPVAEPTTADPDPVPTADKAPEKACAAAECR